MLTPEELTQQNVAPLLTCWKIEPPPVLIFMIGNSRFAIAKLAVRMLLFFVVLLPSAAWASAVVTSVSCGLDHSLFSKSDGSLWAMGDNTYGQLGIGFAPTKTNTPQQVLSSGVGVVSAGGDHSLFRIGSSLWMMGFNNSGQLGDGTTNNHVFPEQIFSGSLIVGVSVIAGGWFHTLFSTSGPIAGSTGLHVTGNNEEGELGDGAFTNRDTSEVIVSTGISAIAGGFDSSFFVRTDGSLWGMGRNAFGQLGIGANPSSTNRPVQIVASGVTTVAAGADHTLFRKSDGSLWAMGANSHGELGDNSTSNKYTPEQIVFNGVTAIAAGFTHSLFVKSNGSLWGMGDNASGELGDGTTTNRTLPVLIVASNVVAAAAGGGFSLFIKSDGSLWGMGHNSSGQLGDGSFTNHLTPFQIVAGLPPAPIITSASLSRTNLSLTGADGVSGETLFTLTSTNLELPLDQWPSIATNVLNAAGNFTITVTNAVSPTAPQRFYILQAQ